MLLRVLSLYARVSVPKLPRRHVLENLTHDSPDFPVFSSVWQSHGNP